VQALRRLHLVLPSLSRFLDLSRQSVVAFLFVGAVAEGSGEFGLGTVGRGSSDVGIWTPEIYHGFLFLFLES